MRQTNNKHTLLFFLTFLFFLFSIGIKAQETIATAQQYLIAGQPNQALTTLIKLNPTKKNQGEIDFTMARCKQMMMENDSAVFYFNKAIAQLAGKKKNKPIECYYKTYLSNSLRADSALQIVQENIDFYEKKKWNKTLEYATAQFVLGRSYARKGRQFFPIATETLQAAIGTANQLEQKPHTLIATCQVIIGQLARLNSEFQTAVQYFEASEKSFLAAGGENHFSLWGLYLNWSGCLNEMGAPQDAVGVCLKGIENMKNNDPQHPFLPNIYNTIGNAFAETGDFESSILYFNKCLSLRPNVGRYYNNLGNAYKEKNDTTNARINFEKSIELLLENDRRNAIELARPYHNLSVIFRSQGDNQRSLEYSKKSLKYRHIGYGKELNLNTVHSYLSIAYSYEELEKYELAELYLDSAIVAQREIIPNDLHPDRIETMLFKAEMAAIRNDLAEQKDNIDKALVTAKSLAPNTYLIALNAKADFLSKQYQLTLDTTILVENATVLSEMINTILQQRNILGDKDKANLAKDHFDIFEQTITTHLQLDKAAQKNAFEYAEKSKSLSLLESISSSKALSEINVDPQLLKEEERLRIALVQLEKNKLIRIEKGMDLTEWESDYFNLQQQYDLLMQHLENDYPSYHNLKYNLQTVSVATVQKDLMDEQTLLEYFIGDSTIYAFIINKNDYQIHEIKNDFPLADWVKTFRQANHYNYFQSSTREYAEIAHKLYQKLIAPFAQELNNQLIIVPDGILGYLPFESLLTKPIRKPNRYKSYPYLLKAKQISYCYSATLLQEMRNKKHQKTPTKELLAFAPFYDGDTTLIATLVRSGVILDRMALSPLPNSGEEVYAIQKIVDGDVFYHDVATEDAFTANAADYRLLHLSTHGKANDKVGDYSYLVFTEQKDSIENELLYVWDLYNLQLNADMVVLSACETGIGELQKGEGIISLARGFTYAGAKSIITSMWSVKDETTKDLMILFYQNLQQGMTKDAALCQAKLQYINELAPQEQKMAHPFYWSGFIGIGDMEAVFVN